VGTVHLTRAQRRQMQKLAKSIESATLADSQFFKWFPHRYHRVRLATPAEISQQELLVGRPILAPQKSGIFVAVRCIAPGVRLRLIGYRAEGSPTDVDEATAREFFEALATPQTQEIEAALRKATVDRAS
jgi:hypothetical protein